MPYTRRGPGVSKGSAVTSYSGDSLNIDLLEEQLVTIV